MGMDFDERTDVFSLGIIVSLHSGALDSLRPFTHFHRCDSSRKSLRDAWSMRRRRSSR